MAAPRSALVVTTEPSGLEVTVLDNSLAVVARGVSPATFTVVPGYYAVSASVPGRDDLKAMSWARTGTEQPVHLSISNPGVLTMGAASSTTPAPIPAAVPEAPPVPVPESLIREIDAFVAKAQELYTFNSRADTLLNLGGIALSVGVVCAGVFNNSKLATILGSVMTAVVTAQRAFPFNQRWQFYRMLLSQGQNLATKAKTGSVTKDQALAQLAELRLDYAQQIPRGTAKDQDAGASTTTATTTAAAASPGS